MIEKYWVNNECEVISDKLMTDYSPGTRIFVRKEKKIVDIFEHEIVTFMQLKPNDEIYVMSARKRIVIT